MYRFGANVGKAIEEARRQVANLVGCYPHEVLFTSGATEANNAAIHGAVFGQSEKNHVITSQVEHSSVLGYCRYLEQYHNVRVAYLPVDRNGALDLDKLHQAITKETAVVSLMAANNETGVLFPTEDIARICSSRNVLFHSDAVQTAGKIPLQEILASANYISISGHKIGAPKGVGVLVIRDGAAFVPLIHGGKQQAGRRGGTDAVPGIIGLGTAADIANQNLSTWCSVRELRERFEEQLITRFRYAEVFGRNVARLPNTTNVRVPGLDGDAAVTFFDRAGICISSGSACLDSSISPSHVIQAMTGSYDEATECIRISTGVETTRNDLDDLLSQLEILDHLFR
jgi:cysteine desulfurase